MVVTLAPVNPLKGKLYCRDVASQTPLPSRTARSLPEAASAKVVRTEPGGKVARIFPNAAVIWGVDIFAAFRALAVRKISRS